LHTAEERLATAKKSEERIEKAIENQNTEFLSLKKEANYKTREMAEFLEKLQGLREFVMRHAQPDARQFYNTVVDFSLQMRMKNYDASKIYFFPDWYII
jgi:predicted  nucleic acid-binding Zn-ribbon protein